MTAKKKVPEPTEKVILTIVFTETADTVHMVATGGARRSSAERIVECLRETADDLDVQYGFKKPNIIQRLFKKGN
jgi:hypothetical protein